MLLNEDGKVEMLLRDGVGGNEEKAKLYCNKDKIERITLFERT